MYDVILSAGLPDLLVGILALADEVLGGQQVMAHQQTSAIRLMLAERPQNGGVLVVGVGNSGADISIEVSRNHSTMISGKETGQIPWPIESFLARYLLVRLVRFVGHHVMTVKTAIGRKLRPKMLHQAAPLVRVKVNDLMNAGIERVPRVVGVKNGMPLLADGRTLNVKNVIWCTGYEHGMPWIDLPIFGENGGTDPIHREGVVVDVPGMYFVGLHFLYAMTSATLFGIGRDAKRIVKAIRSQTRISAIATDRQRRSIHTHGSTGLIASTEDAQV